MCRRASAAMSGLSWVRGRWRVLGAASSLQVPRLDVRDRGGVRTQRLVVPRLMPLPLCNSRCMQLVYVHGLPVWQGISPHQSRRLPVSF